MDRFSHIAIFLVGLVTVLLTLSSALSTFVLPRAARSQLNRIVFGLLRRLFDFILHFARTYPRKDGIMAYYAPIGLMLLVPTWYVLIMLGFAAMYWAMGVGDFFAALRLSGSSLLTLGFESNSAFPVTLFEFFEAMLGLILVALLIAYLPTLYSAFSRREQVVNMLEVRAGKSSFRAGDAAPLSPQPGTGKTGGLLEGVGGLVCRCGGEPYHATGLDLFPLTACRELLGDRGRRSPGCGGDHAVRG